VQISGLNNIPVSIDIPKSIGEVETAWFDKANTDRIAIVNTTGVLHLWNHETKQIVRLPQDLGEVVQFAYFDRNNPDRVLLISDRKVGVWNIQKGSILLAPALLTKHLIINAEFIPNNPNAISILDSTGQMHFWQIGNNTFYNEPRISSPEIINTFKFMHSSSKDILIIYKNQTVESKDINELKQRPLISISQGGISSISLNDNYPDKLLTGSNSGTVKLWDMTSPQKQLTVEVTQNKSVKSTQLNPNNLNQVLTLDADGKVSLHDIGGEKLLKASLNNISRCFSEQELKEYSLDRQGIEKYFTARGNAVEQIYLDKIHCQGK
jgi:WD40 repeat protein